MMTAKRKELAEIDYTIPSLALPAKLEFKKGDKHNES